MGLKELGMSLTSELKPEKIVLVFLLGLFLSSFGECQKPEPLPPLYKPCNDSCTAPLECIDYSFLSPKIGKRCEIMKPATNAKPCLTEVEEVAFFRWRFQLAKAKVVKTENSPKIGWANAGCYLEKGEICNMDKHKDDKAETWEVCKVDHGCVAIKDKWGFCRYSSSPTFVISSSLLLLVLAVTCSSI